MFRIIIFPILLIFVFENISAQAIEEALRYSILNYNSSARNMAVGGSMGALGADFSAGAANPAGFAEYRKSEFAGSVQFGINSTDASIRGNDANSDTKNTTNLSQLGIVLNNTPIASPWQTANFFITFNRIADFNRRFQFDGSGRGSITDRFLELGFGSTPGELDDFEAGLAYDVGAIYDFDDDFFYESDFDDVNVDVQKAQNVIAKGGINELQIGIAGNWSNKVSIGASFGLPFLSYTEEKTYTQDDPNAEIPFFDELEFYEFLETSGVGINGKIGVILKPTKFSRLGASFHTPTLYFLTDDFEKELTYAFTDNEGAQTFNQLSPLGNFKYRITTPWRAILSAGQILRFDNIAAFISGELEYLDYSKNKFNLTSNTSSSGDEVFQEELNEEIDAEFQSVWNFRLGSEIAYQKLRFRAGYRVTATPYAQKATNLSIGNAITGGFGYRGNNVFLDLAIQFQNNDDIYYPYQVSDNNLLTEVNRETTVTKIILTLGLKI